jgi:hypothetical protein
MITDYVSGSGCAVRWRDIVRSECPHRGRRWRQREGRGGGYSSEALVIPESDRDPIAKRIQQIVFSFVVLVADPKAFDLVDQMIARFTLVDCRGRASFGGCATVARAGLHQPADIRALRGSGRPPAPELT